VISRAWDETVLLSSSVTLQVQRGPVDCCALASVDPFYLALGNQIEAVRRARHMSQAQLGEALTPPQTRASVSNFENGKQRVLVHTLVQIAQALSVDLNTLIPDSSAQWTPSAVEKELASKLPLPLSQIRALARKLELTRKQNELSTRKARS